MESFPLFSPRTSESPCTGTERSPHVPLGILQEAVGEASLGGRCSQPRACDSSWSPPIYCSFLSAFWICVGKMGV